MSAPDRPTPPRAADTTAWTDARRAPLVPVEPSPPRSADSPPPAASAAAKWNDDPRAARRLLLTTLVGSALVSAGLEWEGWQIVQRTSGAFTGVPLGDWARGAAGTFGGALGVGAGGAALAMLVPRSWRRPWRAASAAFAIGAAAFLAFLTFLTSLAP